MAIQHIVFDVGNVLFSYVPSKIVDTLVPNSPLKSFYLTHLFDTPLWLELDRGDIGIKEAIEILRPYPNTRDYPLYEGELTHLIQSFCTVLDVIRPTKDLFDLFSHTKSTFILSNFQADPFDRLLSLHPFLSQASGMVVSAKIRSVKPESAIYQHLFDTYQLDPATCLFIDDRHENIVAGEKLGMKGLVYSTDQQLTHDLSALGLCP